MEPIEGSETSAFKPQTPGKYPKENILHKEHGESLKSRQYFLVFLISDKYPNSWVILMSYIFQVYGEVYNVYLPLYLIFNTYIRPIITLFCIIVFVVLIYVKVMFLEVLLYLTAYKSTHKWRSQAIYMQCNIDEYSLNHFCRGKQRFIHILSVWL